MWKQLRVVLPVLVALFMICDSFFGAQWALRGAQTAVQVLARKTDSTAQARMFERFEHTDSMTAVAIEIGYDNQAALERIMKIPVISASLSAQNRSRIRDSIIDAEDRKNLFVKRQPEWLHGLNNY